MEPINLRDLERKAYFSYNEDGLIDILIGSILLLLGSYIILDPQIPLTLLVMLLGPIVWAGLKRKFTIPRVGFVKFGAGPRGKQRRILLILLVVFQVMLVLATATSNRAQGDRPFWLVMLDEYGVLIVGSSIVSVILNLVGYFNEAKRFNIYTVASVFLFTAAHSFLGSDLDIWQKMAYAEVPLGLLMIVNGLWTLRGFIEKYPIYNGETGDEQ
jgi:hypothetical protein